MALNPIPAAFVAILGYITQGLIIGSGEVIVDFPTFEFGGGVVDFFTGAFESIGEVIKFIAQFLSFELVGMPWFLGVPIAVGTSGVMIWSGFELARGT